MGTNYYLHENVCECCGRGDPPLHIGKSSGGWCFALHVIPEEGLNSLDDWVDRIVPTLSGDIRDEYDCRVFWVDLRRLIIDRSKKPGTVHSDQFYRDNHAEPGPNGLLRHQIGLYCLGHGKGTWDLIPGEFS